MSEFRFAFDRVVVMDALPLTGQALCDLTDGEAGRPCSEYVTSMPDLRRRLHELQNQRVLVISEIKSEHDSLRDGMALLTDIQQGHCRVMVCTALSDPLLLRAVVNRRPAVVTLRRESLSVLRQAIRMAGVAWPDTVLSPAVTDGLTLTRDVKLTPRELEWLVTQGDGMGMKESARVMNISYKTVATYRRNIALRLGGEGARTFTFRLAQLHNAGDRH